MSTLAFSSKRPCGHARHHRAAGLTVAYVNSSQHHVMDLLGASGHIVGPVTETLTVRLLLVASPSTVGLFFPDPLRALFLGGQPKRKGDP